MEAAFSSDSHSTSSSIDSTSQSSTHPEFTIVDELAKGHGDVRVYLVETEGRETEVLKTSCFSLEREGRMMEAVSGHNVVRLIGHGEDERMGSWLHMEWCESGDLFKLVKKHGAFAENICRRVVSQLVGALQTCHNVNVAHLDVKLENCYVCRDGTVKLGDFGHARKNKSDLKNLKTGTLQYQAPEIRLKQPYDGCMADVFSLGVCVFVLFFGRRPWKSAAVEDQYFMLYRTNRRDFWRRQTPHISDSALSFLEGLLTVDPQERPSLDEVRVHPWLKGPKASVTDWLALLN